MNNLFAKFMLFAILINIFTPFCYAQATKNETEIASACMINPTLTQRVGTLDEFKNAYKCLAGKELTAVRLEKGRKFDVKSLQPMSANTKSGTIVKFESIYEEKLFVSKEPAKLLFTGEILENNPPGKAGSSGVIKIQIQKVKIDNITYPISAFISKMNKKGVHFNNLALDSLYIANLLNTANKGTITIDKVYKDPCEASNCLTGINTVARPFYFLAGAALQAADLLLSPIIALLQPGKDIFIPENTQFEIKLDENLPVLVL